MRDTHLDEFGLAGNYWTSPIEALKATPSMGLFGVCKILVSHEANLAKV